EIKGFRELIIVPDGELAKVSFDSFVLREKRADGKKNGRRHKYLLEKYRVKYIQSASLLATLRTHYFREGKSGSFIGFGDPVYDYNNYKPGRPGRGELTRGPGTTDEIDRLNENRFARAGGILNRLPRSGDEVKLISRLFDAKGRRWVVYSREDAVEEKAKSKEMAAYDYIHFACHGLLNEQFQSLVLTQRPPGESTEDGYLTLNEIMNCQYDAKLVVLSACRTGAGKMEKGEGVTGLARAVMYAGTPAVVACLWDVDDSATEKLMIAFYKHLLTKNMDKAEALRQAKLQLLETTRFSSPLYWSSFVMYGE
ncbi:MAG: CHAT domain-containing protein, partial [bacterium]|nr:CHAT domain-containing protein [bacterium]